MMMRAAVSFAAAMLAAAVHGAAPMDTPAGVAASVVQDVPGYNSWPMVQAIGGRLVCAYSRGSAHTIGEGKRGVYARTSSDGGRTWAPEVCVVNDPALGEVTIGKGLDNDGAMLLWVRSWGRIKRHDLYRTVDGVHYGKISSPDLSPMPIQITDVFKVPGVGLMSLWFAGNYREEGKNSWGTLTSADNGRTWTQRTVERNLAKADWPTEQSAVHLGGGRILAVARSEGGTGSQFQLMSADGGTTWRRAKTNISDVRESTPSLIFDRETGLVVNYYYQRGARKMKRRTAKAADIFDSPDAWPGPETLAEGHEKRAHDAGNVNAIASAGRHYLATYTGTDRDTTVLVLSLEPPCGLVPDVSVDEDERGRATAGGRNGELPIEWFHRRDKTADHYFVVATGKNGYVGEVTFSMEGDVSVLDPETGRSHVPEIPHVEDNSTTVKLNLAPSKGVFVVFRH